MPTPSITALRDPAIGARITGAWPLRGVRAGSALLTVGPRLLAIQDDAFAAVWIDPVTRATTPLALHGSGEPLAKADKPDFETAFAHDSRLWVLGSGALPNRCVLARIDLSRREALVQDMRPLFDAVERALGQRPNIEGAVPLGDRLRLFQRGPGRTAEANFAVDVPLDVLTGGTPQVLGVARYDLGAVDGIFFGFTDAVLIGGQLAYLAVAEDTPDGIADGAVVGAAIGLAGAKAARWGPVTEADGSPSRRKVEGIAVDATGGWLLTDPDDAERPAELCRVTLKFA